MTVPEQNSNTSKHDELYVDAEYWHVNTGSETIHAKRMPGRFRTLKWITGSVWLVFFFGPYLRWHGRQAILFDIPGRQFHIFDITILPQDVWMLSLVLLFFAILLAVVTSIAGRVFCGYFCFQTVWTDVFTFIEEKIEGTPQKRRKFDAAPWDASKIVKKVIKHGLWLIIAMLTGLSFAAWFTDVFQLWHDYFHLEAPTIAWGILGAFTVGTYTLAGHMREQVCFWLCPYARIQGVMCDRETILPSYDYNRGEPRGKLKKGQIQEGKGDCIECGQCVAVCPTGIDIRHGQQEGCITCALCIDACDSVMEKIGKPKGLIRYASLDEIQGKPTLKLWQRPRPIVYITIMTIAFSGIVYGLTHLGSIELKVLHERQPLYVLQSDGSIQNKYYLKILNKTDKEQDVMVKAEGIKGLTLVDADKPVHTQPGNVTEHTVYIRIPPANLHEEVTPVEIEAYFANDHKKSAEYKSMFFGPKD